MIVPDSSASPRRRIPRYLRTFGYAATVCTIAIVACESHVPTAADISGLDAASAEKNAGQLQLIATNGQLPTYYVDDIMVADKVAQAIPSDSIATISVVRAHTAGERSQVRIIKVGSPLRSATLQPFMRTDNSGAVGPAANTSGIKIVRGVAMDGDASPVFFIDGVAASAVEFKAIDPKNIESVEVVKGPAAAALESQYPNAKNGVIRVTLKH